MESQSQWVRVNRQHRCPICNHDSWCLYKETVVICMRQTSPRPKQFKSGEVGYLHRPNEPLKVTCPSNLEPVVTIDVHKLLSNWSKASDQDQKLNQLAGSLCLRRDSLAALGCVFAGDYRAWAFPMRNGYGGLVGIRLRDGNGKKWAVRGSHQGLFIPTGPMGGDLCVVCEGPTDTAAALALGYFAVGRPSCAGGTGDLASLFQSRRVRRAVIVADNDKPGLDGARQLADYLPIPTCTVIMPCKDVREFVTLGGDRVTFQCLIDSSVWTRK